MIVYNRKTKEMEQETEYGETTIEFLYHTILGRCILKWIVARPFFSKIRSFYQKSPRSRKEIIPFIKKYAIEMTGYAKDYDCFHDFFIRKRKINQTAYAHELIAIADSKLLVYKIDENLRLNVKHSSYTLQEIVENEINLAPFKNGICLVFRLSISDCHRYHFIDGGKYIQRYRIKGLLHTVRPISAQYRIFSRNQREVSLLQTEQLGVVIQVEVGALLVGCIKNHDTKSFAKLEEKGYFEYGGSTIIVFLQNKVKIDADILENSHNGIETKVEIGEKIGEIIDCCAEKTEYLL